MAKHYDVAVLGGGLSALACAALLARRAWRVIVLGQGHRPAIYAYDSLPLARRSFTFLAATSPAFSRILVELAQSQTFKRRLLSADPMFHALLSGRAIEVAPDTHLFAREIDREFPEVRRVVDELYAELARVNAAADGAFDRDVNWSPSAFFESHETKNALSLLPRVGDASYDVLAEFPRAHPFREIVLTSVRFAADQSADLPPIAVARLHGAWTRGLFQLPHGEDELAEFFLERVRAHGGDVRLSESAESIVVRSGRVNGIVIGGDETETGAQFVIGDRGTRDLYDLGGFSPSRRAAGRRAEAVPRRFRFVVSMLVQTAGVPAALARESFLIPDHRSGAVHLQRTSPPGCPEGCELLVAETLITAEEAQSRVRPRVLATVETFLPFLERHYVLIDSPHDGLPAYDHRSGTRVEVPRAALRSGGGSVEAEPMIAQVTTEPGRLFDLGGEPSATALRGAYVVGRTTLPALGQEGELLTALGTARVITRTDRRKERMRQEMWSKIEIA